MKFVQFWYMYRDNSNYKRHNSVVFANPADRKLEEIDAEIRKCLIDGEWFLHTTWNLPDMHVEKTDCKEDHPFHEYNFVEETTGGESNAESIDNFLLRIAHRAITTRTQVDSQVRK